MIHLNEAPAVTMAGLFCLAAALAGPSRAQEAQVWFGPKAFTSGREVRPDFFPMLAHVENWRDIAARADVFKSYIMILPGIPVPGKDEPELSDTQLRQLIAVLEEHGLKTAFEVGGARARDDGAGAAAAENEFVHLKRWLDLGGSIDYLTTDHSIAFGIEAWLDTKDPAVSGAMSYDDPEVRDLLHDLCDQLAAYYARMNELIPGLTFGAIESLGYWWLEAETGDVYEPTRPDLPDLPFTEVFDYLVRAVENQGLTLEHFHTDYGYWGARHDGAGEKLGYGRILAVEAAVRKAGVRNGNIVNAYHDRLDPDLDAAAANQQAVDNTLAFFEGYLATGQPPDAFVFQTWQPYPDKTGPETAVNTVMYLHRLMLTHDAFPTDTGYVRVELGPPAAVAAGAMWSVDGGATWYESNAIAPVPKGTVDILFRTIPGWAAPEPARVDITGNATVTVESGTAYEPGPAALPTAGAAALLVAAAGVAALTARPTPRR